MKSPAAPASAPAIRNALTVDVEDYFQVQAFAEAVPRPSWDTIAPRVEANVDRILEQFGAARVRATFFTLGWVAERHPGMLRRIAGEGHELASHGYDHRRADRLAPLAFRNDVGRTKRLIEDIAGVPVIGYRAPTFSIGRRNLWAFALLEREGYRYSSSINPIRHDLYGMPDAPRFPFRPGPGELWELPMTTVRLWRQNLPCSGGGYFRLLPYQLYRRGLERVNRVERAPGIFYFHPWEIDAAQPRIRNCGRLARFRHYVNIAAMPGRLERLLADFAWDRMDRVFATLLQLPEQPRAGTAAKRFAAATA
jgi:polysaccharide deacetylase family protein (PEP-CTERM system associated)